VLSLPELDNIETQTQAANATNAKVIKIKKEVEQAQDNLIQAQQSVATLEKKIQANNQAIISSILSVSFSNCWSNSSAFCFNESI
jgi:lipid II:glycine glycyltransferase (peptidoglycan interpeptide bridge formation enzyme)